MGGVVVGQDLIQAAKLRDVYKNITNTESYAIAFKLKYNAMPGDVEKTQAASFGLTTVNCAGTGCGDKNKIIEAPTVHSGRYWKGEHILFWKHLQDVDYINQDIGVIASQNGGNQWGSYDATLYTHAYRLGWPEAKNFMMVFTENGRNYLQIAHIRSHDSGNAYVQNGLVFDNCCAFNSLRAYQIDSKYDDGDPTSGAITASGANEGNINSAYSFNGSPTTGDGLCLVADGSAYNLTGDSLENRSCNLTFKTSF